MNATSIKELKTVKKGVKKLVEAALTDTGGLLRLAPCSVPRSFLQPGKRLKLHPDDLYAYGLNRGGIDERWFASTTPAANENRTPDEGLSYCVVGKQRFTLQQAVAECGATLIGSKIWKKYKKWPVYSKFLTTWDRFRITCINQPGRRRSWARKASPNRNTFRPSTIMSGTIFPI